jgi:hypothetical protein
MKGGKNRDENWVREGDEKQKIKVGGEPWVFSKNLLMSTYESMQTKPFTIPF